MNNSPLSTLSQTNTILLMGAIAIIPMLPITLYIPILPHIASQFGYDTEIFQLTLPLFIISQVVAMPITAMLSDTGYRLQALYWALMVFIIGTVLCIGWPSLWLFCTGRVLQAFSAATLMTVIPALINECYDTNSVARILSYVTAIGFVIPIVGPELSTLASQHWSWYSVFVFMLAYSMTTFLICRRSIGKATPPANRLTIEPLKKGLYHWKIMVQDKETQAFLVCHTGIAVVGQIYISNSAFLFLDYYQLTEISYSYLISVLYVSRTAITLINGLLLKHIPYSKLIDLSLPVLMILALCMLLLDWFYGASLIPSLILVVAFFALSGLVVTNALTGVLKNHESWSMQASALLFIVFSGTASMLNIALIALHDGTPRVLSMVSMLILILTYLLYQRIKSGS
ncbi:MFS transporter [Endozoicomonas elysicola]|nr:MFS transporter [Endozoicomonas elysicola]